MLLLKLLGASIYMMWKGLLTFQVMYIGTPLPDMMVIHLYNMTNSLPSYDCSGCSLFSISLNLPYFNTCTCCSVMSATYMWHYICTIEIWNLYKSAVMFLAFNISFTTYFNLIYLWPIPTVVHVALQWMQPIYRISFVQSQLYCFWL